MTTAAPPTLDEIARDCDAAAAAGAPPVQNWPQLRASLLLLDRAVGLDRVPAAQFAQRFPESFGALEPALQPLFLSRRNYGIMHGEITRLLSLQGYGDPWEALRLRLRRLERMDLEQRMSRLQTASKAAGLAPAELRADWVWSHDAERIASALQPVVRDARSNAALLRWAPFGVRRKAAEARRVHRRAEMRRGSWRLAVVAFDALFDLPELAESGLLPPARIGAPPAYDRRGRRRVPLPPVLARIDAQEGGKTYLQELWQAICAAAPVDLPADPVADDLLRVWPRIAALSPRVLAVTAQSWRHYLRLAQKALRRHTTAHAATPAADA